MQELRELLHPGPPPRGWMRFTLIMVTATALVCSKLIALGWFTRGDPGKHFGEGKIGTLLSVAFLLGAAWVCWSNYRRWPHDQSLRRFWFGMSIIFVIAGLDDMYKLHERLDTAINNALGIDPKHPIADRLDDVLVLGYALPAVVLAFMEFRALLRQRWMVWALTVAFACFLAMVFVDALHMQHDALEDSMKLLAGAMIVCGLRAAIPEGSIMETERDLATSAAH